VLSHFHFSKIFVSSSSLSVLKEYFALCMDLSQHREGRHWSANPNIPSLQRDAVYFVNLHTDPSDSYEEILVSVKVATLDLLDAYIEYFPALSKFTTEPIPGREYWETSDPASMWKLWKIIDAAERLMNDVKSAQLQRIAQLLLNYPNMLRGSRDISQELRSHSLPHRVSTFERNAQRMLKPQVLRRDFIAKRIFSQHRLPVVPYDRHLKCFLKVLEKFPVVVQSNNTTSSRKPYMYPPEVAGYITKAVQGMAYVYTREAIKNDTYSDLRILRTKSTPYSAKGYQSSFGLNQPRFMNAEDGEGIDNENDKIMPMEEKEFEWLEAFLKSCAFMSNMDMEWTKGVTVKKFWAIHTGGV
jgi:hypothetical protein